MNRATLATAIAEAERFIARAKAMPDDKTGTLLSWAHPREQGAIKRASMDLTRALADLRRPS